MHILKVKDKAALGKTAAELLIQSCTPRFNALVALPTGSTPAPLYAHLRGRYVAGEQDFSSTHFTQLDEYCGLTHDDPRSFAGWLSRELLNPLNIPADHRLMMDGTANPAQEAVRIEDTIRAHGGRLDMAILGLGENGHLAFNEPGTAFDSRTHRVRLTEETRESNALYWGDIDLVPQEALTLGLGTIMDAHEIVLLVSGDSKAEALRETVTRTPSPDFPASCLQLHKNVTVIADEPASRLLPDSLNLA
ncbi:MAG: 6-phosphogluconolactonase [Pseudobdellovibrionaceae bacterium]